MAESAFAALADPTRRAILTLLKDAEPVSVTQIAQEFPQMTRAAVSSHLRVLRHAGLVEEQRRGQFREYRLGPNRADDVVSFLIATYSAGLDELQRSSSKK